MHKIQSSINLTSGPIMRSMLAFAAPMIAGNLLQQCYNIADTVIVGQFLGGNALAAVGSSFSLMTFLTSIILGLCMGSGALFSMHYGRKDDLALSESIAASVFVVSLSTVALTCASYTFLNLLENWLNVPADVWPEMRRYLFYIFLGIPATAVYNFYACLLRAVGNSLVPLLFLGIAAVANIILDLLFVCVLETGVWGTALATILSQYAAALFIHIYTRRCFAHLCVQRGTPLRAARIKEVGTYSFLTCAQQSVMNLGILMVQGLVNSFGTNIMAAFAAGVKVDAFAYTPVQDFGNAFSTFTAQNYGAQNSIRIQRGFKGAVLVSVGFSLVIAVLVVLFAQPLMGLFVQATDTGIILAGVDYLRIEGAFYPGIALLFLFYGLYRALAKPAMSLVLTIISLGSRVVLAYMLSAIPSLGVQGIWWSIPIGWGLADLVGFIYYKTQRKKLLAKTLQNS